MSTCTLFLQQVSWWWVVWCDFYRDATGRSLGADPGAQSEHASLSHVWGIQHDP